MEIRLRAAERITIIELTGSLTIGRNEESLRETVTRLIGEERRFVLLNLAEVPTIDSSGIGAVIKCFTSLQEANGQMKVLKPSRMARQLLQITGLLSVLETFEDEQDALKSF